MSVQVRTQEELNKAIADGIIDVEFISAGDFEVNCKFLRVSVKASLKWDVLIKARESSRIEARESSRVEAWESSRVVARGSSRVVARESSRIEARESSRIEARESSRVVARGSSRVVARESSRVVAWESSSIEAWESSRVVARGSSSVVARESSRVVAWESSSIEAWESSRVVARGSSSVVARGSSRIEARESSRIEARESSRVVAWESSRVVARESSSIEAWESSRVVARGSSSVVARGSSSVVAKGFVSVSIWGIGTIKLSATCHAFIHNKEAKVAGGKRTTAIIDTPKKWCDYYGVTVKRDEALLYKAVGSEYRSNYNRSFQYIPGTTPEAPDWDGGKQECGKGLHFSPHPQMTKEFLSSPSHYLGCWVKLSEMAIHMDGSYPQKCKAKRVCCPVFEVDEDGNPLEKATT